MFFYMLTLASKKAINPIFLHPSYAELTQEEVKTVLDVFLLEKQIPVDEIEITGFRKITRQEFLNCQSQSTHL